MSQSEKTPSSPQPSSIPPVAISRIPIISNSSSFSSSPSSATSSSTGWTNVLDTYISPFPSANALAHFDSSWHRFPLQLLQYGSAVGESIKPLVPKYITNSLTIVSIGYILGRSMNQSREAELTEFHVNMIKRVSRATLLDSIMTSWISSVTLPSIAVASIVRSMELLVGTPSNTIIENNQQQQIPINETVSATTSTTTNASSTNKVNTPTTTATIKTKSTTSTPSTPLFFSSASTTSMTSKQFLQRSLPSFIAFSCIPFILPITNRVGELISDWAFRPGIRYFTNLTTLSTSFSNNPSGNNSDNDDILPLSDEEVMNILNDNSLLIPLDVDELTRAQLEWALDGNIHSEYPETLPTNKKLQ